MNNLYFIVCSIFLGIVLITINFIYIIHSEKIKSNLSKEVQLQSITINTMNKINQKQQMLINANQELLNQQSKDEKKLSQKQQSATELNTIKDKKKALNNIFNL